MSENVQLRTALMWLESHRLSAQAECWVLAGDDVEPVTGVTCDGDVTLTSRPVWGDPSPTPLPYGLIYDKIMEQYSGGGSIKWEGHSETYRGSYVVDPAKAVFFLFLPESVMIVESHEEKMEQRRQQARQLTREIERSQHAR